MTEVDAAGTHALSRVLVQPGDLVPVIATVPVGLTTALMAELAVAESLALLGKTDAALQVPDRPVRSVTINADRADSAAPLKTWSHGRGWTVVFEAVGGMSETLTQSTKIAEKRGKIWIVGS